MKVIGVMGFAGSGKSTVAKHLANRYGYVRQPFAGPIKDMSRALGLTEEETDGHLKEAPCDLLDGQTPRFFMQQLGTEFGRETISRDLWVNAWKRRLPAYTSKVVAEDVRFANEVYTIRQLGGVLVEVHRPGKEPGNHDSEKVIELAVPDHILVNRGSIEELLDLVDRVVKP